MIQICAHILFILRLIKRVFGIGWDVGLLVYVKEREKKEREMHGRRELYLISLVDIFNKLAVQSVAADFQRFVVDVSVVQLYFMESNVC